MQKKGFRGARIALTVVGALAVLLIALLSVYMLWERAPHVEASAARAEVSLSERPLSAGKREDAGLPFDTCRQDGLYTILLVGNDDGTGNTDTIMVGRIDTKKHRMDFVSIPRDTLIDVDWEVKKLNAVYWGAVNAGGSGSEALCRHIRKLIGFDVDCYAVLDLSDFIDVVDSLGGVWFEVPQAMHYEDPSQNLSIHLEPGYQQLDGYQAMGVVRYRSSYVNGDLGRIEMQHRFLQACAEQFINLGSIPNVGKVVSILSEGLDTNLSAANIAWFLRQALLCDNADIHFYTAPNTAAMIGGYSYAVINKYEWLNLVNACLNPYDTPVTEDMLSIACGRSDAEQTNQLTDSAAEAALPAALVAEESAVVIPEETVTPEPDPGEAAVSPEPNPEGGGGTGEEGPRIVTVDPAEGAGPVWQEILIGGGDGGSD